MLSVRCGLGRGVRSSLFLKFSMKKYDINTLAQKIGFCQDWLNNELDEVQSKLGVGCVLGIMEKAPQLPEEVDPADPDMWVHMVAHVSYNAGWLDALAMVAPHVQAEVERRRSGGEYRG